MPRQAPQSIRRRVLSTGFYFCLWFCCQNITFARSHPPEVKCNLISLIWIAYS